MVVAMEQKASDAVSARRPAPVTGIVFNTQRFTINDGPGVRTEFFLKGCPLRCKWCSNPESWRREIEYGVYRAKCIGRAACGACEEACPAGGSCAFTRGRLAGFDRAARVDYRPCYDECPSDAIKRWGEEMDVEACMRLVLADRGYYERSGGGVTVSGGEPLLQSEFVAALFAACRDEGIHTCCESTFHVAWDAIERVMPVTDLFITDIKHMDTEAHRAWTGAGNERVLAHMRRVVEAGFEPIVRIPVIPGVNDDDANIAATADFILDPVRGLGGRVRVLQLLSFMRLGVEKYQSLGIPYGAGGIKVNRKSFQRHVEEIAAYMNGRGIHCLVGTKERQ